MKTEIKALRLFLELKKPMTIREISKGIGSDYRITYTAVQRLLEKDILISESVGKSTLCSLNDAYYGTELYLAETERKGSLLENKDVRQLYKEVLSRLKTSFFIFLVFGSYAKKSQNRSSDFDLIFISDDPDFEDKISSMLSLLPLKVHALVFTPEEFVRMKGSKEINVVKEAVADNVILYGIETYYRLKNL